MQLLGKENWTNRPFAGPGHVTKSDHVNHKNRWKRKMNTGNGKSLIKLVRLPMLLNLEFLWWFETLKILKDLYCHPDIQILLIFWTFKRSKNLMLKVIPLFCIAHPYCAYFLASLARAFSAVTLETCILKRIFTVSI